MYTPVRKSRGGQPHSLVLYDPGINKGFRLREAVERVIGKHRRDMAARVESHLKTLL